MKSAVRLAIVIPCYNEEEALAYTVPQINMLIDSMVEAGEIAPDSYMMLVDDGSRDRTWEIIADLHKKMPRRVKGLTLAHNRGHQNALLAGLMAVKDRCDAAVSIDADLQDDPQAIRRMVSAFTDKGAEIVYGVRSSRATDTAFKRRTAHAFYSFQRSMGLDTVYDHADYRLMSARALQLLAEYGESNLFLRGIVPQIGLKTEVVTYERAARVAGESKYPLKKMLSFSIDGITSFTAQPIRMIFFVGLTLLVLDILVAIYVLNAHFFGVSVSGWASIMLSVWFLGSLILMGIGIVGEYIGKIFVEVKKRPRYAVKDELF